jgi:hypothetical protein
MGAELVGAAKQLVTLLRRHFITVGVPPQPPRYDYECPVPLIRDRKRNMSVMDRKLDASPESVMFRALLIDSDDVREITDNIRVISDVAHAMRKVATTLDSDQSKTARFAYVFSRLCERQWAGSVGVGIAVENHVATKQVWQYWLEPIESEFLDDLEAAINEISGVSDMSRDTGTAIALTFKEKCIIDAIGDGELTGEKIAECAGFPPNSSLRATLSNMVKRGLLAKGLHGYRVP